MLDFSKKELKFKYDGNEYCIRFPSLKDLSLYQNKYKKVGDDNASQVVLEFLVDLGLDKSVAEVLEANHVEAIMKELTDAKKN